MMKAYLRWPGRSGDAAAIKRCYCVAISPSRTRPRVCMRSRAARQSKTDKLSHLASVLQAASLPPKHRSCAHQGGRDAVLVVQNAPCGYAFKTALQTRLALAAQ